MYVAIATIIIVLALYTNALAHERGWTWKVKLDAALDAAEQPWIRIKARIKAKIAAAWTRFASWRHWPKILGATGQLVGGLLVIAVYGAMVVGGLFAVGVAIGGAREVARSEVVRTQAADVKAAAVSAVETYQMRRDMRKLIDAIDEIVADSASN